MTSSRYFVAKTLASFGINFRTRRMGEAAAETHLLREAEEVLGLFCWENVEHIEDITPDFWALRKLKQERDKLIAEVEDAKQQLLAAHQERQQLLQKTGEEPESPLERERMDLILETEDLVQQREDCIESARKVKHSYSGLKTKAEVVAQEEGADSEAVKEILQQLKAIKEKFNELKKVRLSLMEKITINDESIAELDDKISDSMSDHQKEATQTFQSIGEANRRITENRSKIGAIDNQVAKHYLTVGNYISKNATNDPDCREAAKDETVLLRRIHALRESIIMNNKIVGDR